MNKFTLIAAAAALTLSGLAHGHELLARKDAQFRPTGKGFPEAVPEGHARPVRGGGNGINYNGGPVMAGVTVNMYYIWYGNWTNYANAQAVLRRFGPALSGSPLNNTNTSYYNAAGTKVLNSVALSGEYYDSGTLGTSLTDANIFTIVKNVIGAGTPDPNGVYFVLTAPDVQETSGFGSQYCGWHTYGTYNGVATKYSFVGNPLLIAPSGCGVRNPAPNGAGGGDAMASVLFHELVEAVSDPQLNAWYDSRGSENADKCAWTYGTTYTSANGAVANVKLGGYDYLIQRNWVNAAGGYCSMSY